MFEQNEYRPNPLCQSKCGTIDFSKRDNRSKPCRSITSVDVPFHQHQSSRPRWGPWLTEPLTNGQLPELNENTQFYWISKSIVTRDLIMSSTFLFPHSTFHILTTLNWKGKSNELNGTAIANCQDLMQPPCSHRKLKCCSNTAWIESRSVKLVVAKTLWKELVLNMPVSIGLFLKCHLTGESFVASVAAVSLLLTSSCEQPKSLEIECASLFQPPLKQLTLYLSYCSLLITLTIWPSAVAKVIASVSTTSSTTGSHTERSTKLSLGQTA